ncbi:MAG: cation:proton antiporter domain-containing protein [Thermoleophilia bacterium]
MTDYPLLKDVLVLIGVSLATVYFLRLLKVPTIVGFIAAGVLIGPGALGLIEDRHSIELMAEIGVTLLLFTIGLKFSVRELVHMRMIVIGAGGLQVVLTIFATSAILNLAGVNMRDAVFYGFLVSLSSTAIVLKLLEEHGQSHSIFGRFNIGVLLFQDLAVVPLLLLTLLLGGGDMGGWSGAAFTMAKSLALIAALLAFTFFIFPRFFERIARTRSSEIFTLATVLVALGTAYVGSLFGFSLPLGAFLAGVVISESAYAHQILAEITPLRDVLNSLFFVSIGMFVTPALWFEEPLFSLGTPLLIIFFKAVLIAGVALGIGFGSRMAILSGLSLAQVGEFSFVLALSGLSLGLLDADSYSRFLSVAVPTMVLTPLAMLVAPIVAERAPQASGIERLLLNPGRHPLRRFFLPGLIENETDEEWGGYEELEDHVIIVGYGINGRNVARVLTQIEVPYLVLELNPYTVRNLRSEGESIHYGDASRRAVLLHAGIKRARILVVAIADPAMSRQIVAVARKENPRMIIVVRTRLVNEMEDLIRLGADEVVPEEFETSLQLAAVIMANYGISERLIEQEKVLIRRGHYSMLVKQEKTTPSERALSSLLATSEVADLRLDPGMYAVNCSIRELDLRRETGATILAVERRGQISTNPAPDFTLSEGDTVYLVGMLEEVKSAVTFLSKSSSR